MIRLSKPAKVYEWGEGTNTLNQIWQEIGQGTIRSVKTKNGLTDIVIDIKGSVEKRNKDNIAVKIAQQGEGMAARSEHWGEVAMGRLKNIQSASGQSELVIEVHQATKVSN